MFFTITSRNRLTCWDCGTGTHKLFDRIENKGKQTMTRQMGLPVYAIEGIAMALYF
jgi:hypothetical protein